MSELGSFDLLLFGVGLMGGFLLTIFGGHNEQGKARNLFLLVVIVMLINIGGNLITVLQEIAQHLSRLLPQ